MALSDEQISLMAFNDDPGDWNNLAFRDCWVNGYKTGARAVEAEVRKQDEALIGRMLEVLEYVRNTPEAEYDSKAALSKAQAAITAARARLGERRNAS